MEKSKCPRCDHEGWGVFRKGSKLYKLNQGDIVVCRWCGTVLIYETDHYREPTKEEFKRMRSNSEVWKKIVRGLADAFKYLKKDL